MKSFKEKFSRFVATALLCAAPPLFCACSSFYGTPENVDTQKNTTFDFRPFGEFKTYVQRGILEIEGRTLTVTVYAEASEDCYKLSLVCDAGTAAKIAVSKTGKTLFCKAGVFLSEQDCRRFALRDFKNTLGLGGRFEKTQNGTAVILKSASPEYSAEFLDWEKMGDLDRKYPKLTIIQTGAYSLRLHLISITENVK